MKTIRETLQPYANRWRILPTVTFTNWHKHDPRMKSWGLWKKWFSIRRYWGGRIIYITVRHFQLELDFRKSWIADMACGTGKPEPTAPTNQHTGN